jgi:hypothetical protein
LKNAELKTLDAREVSRLKAANGAQIPILGLRNVYFSINTLEGTPMALARQNLHWWSARKSPARAAEGSKRLH